MPNKLLWVIRFFLLYTCIMLCYNAIGLVRLLTHGPYQTVGTVVDYGHISTTVHEYTGTEGITTRNKHIPVVIFYSEEDNLYGHVERTYQEIGDTVYVYRAQKSWLSGELSRVIHAEYTTSTKYLMLNAIGNTTVCPVLLIIELLIIKWLKGRINNEDNIKRTETRN